MKPHSQSYGVTWAIVYNVMQVVTHDFTLVDIRY